MSGPELSDSPSKGGVLSLRWIAYILVPAIIAGFFSFLPTLYTELTKEKSVLTYRVVSGPAISSPVGFQRIFSIILQNHGKSILTNIQLEAKASNSRIETFVIDQDSALQPKVEQSSNAYLVRIQRMHPGESISASAMTVASDAQTSPVIAARSDQTLAIVDADQSSQSKKITPEILSAILTAISVALMGFALPYAAYALGGKADVIALIAALSGVFAGSNNMILREHRMSYRRLGDLLLAHGLSGSDEDKRKAILGLKSLLLVKEIARQSAEIIAVNLEILGEADAQKQAAEMRKRSLALSQGAMLRKQITQFFQ